jgi:glutathione synthase/RimK-type ligase-like ATP-grasp enzyme
MKIALISYGGENPQLVEQEDEKLLQFLNKKGLEAYPEIWDDNSVDWTEYELILLKSPYDYIDNVDGFIKWLSLMQGLNIPLLNPVEKVKWNADKHYLKEISSRNFLVTPTEIIEKGQNTPIASFFNYFKTKQLIIKPCVSGSAKNTFIVPINEIDAYDVILNKLLENESLIVQPFMHEIRENGEWSFIFFNGAYRHSVLKKHKKGDFRVQKMFGGNTLLKKAPEFLIRKSQAYDE